ncbi:MAG: lipopolysaccharide transport periplasmic protein LptA [Deltaproteobacteria bacterium]|jgi:lipopolysaccharide export system protein LptA|nr:MAG: lipopolysaccharide transport periplasmic protein LptA [Deltaproteobacteria bacterium]
MRRAMLHFTILFFILLSSHAMPAAPAKNDAKKDDIKKADDGTKKDDTKKSSTAFEFNKKDPVFITADWMEVDQKQNTITYKGRVVTVQAEMTMRSETLTAYYDPEMKQMKQIIAEGKVNATQGNRVATGEKAVFDDKAKTVTLTGSPVMRQGNSQVSGVKVIYFVEQDKSIVEGDDKNRVRATIFPEELKSREQGDAK